MLADIVKMVEREQQVKVENDARRKAELEAEHQILMEELKTRLQEVTGYYWEAVKPYLVEKQRGHFFIEYLFHLEEMELVDIAVRVTKTGIQASVQHGDYYNFSVGDVNDFIRVLKEAARLYPEWCERQDVLQLQQEIADKYAADYLHWLIESDAIRRRNDERIRAAQEKVEPIRAYELFYGIVAQTDTGEQVIEERSTYVLKDYPPITNRLYQVIENGEAVWRRYYCPIAISDQPDVFAWLDRTDFFKFIATRLGGDEAGIYVNPFQDPPVEMPELEQVPVKPEEPDGLDYPLIVQIRNRVFDEWEGK